MVLYSMNSGEMPESDKKDERMVLKNLASGKVQMVYLTKSAISFSSRRNTLAIRYPSAIA